MPSRKKDRGKQRKAVKQSSNGLAGRASPQAQTVGIKQLKAEGCRVVTSLYGGPTTINTPIFQHMRLSVGGRTPTAAEWRDFDRGLLSDEERRELAENYVHNYAQGMREGDYHATDVVMRNVADPHVGPQLVNELVKADIHLSFLHFLNQRDKTVSDVLGGAMGAEESIKLPSYWVASLGMMLVSCDGLPEDILENTRLAVAKNIGPFVMTMIDDKRELFQSNAIWHTCISPFFDLVRCIMMSRDGFLEMISYEGFLPFVAQSSCWSQSREDIATESKRYRTSPEPLSSTSHAAHKILGLTLHEHRGEVQEDVMRGALDQIACTRLLSNDPKCNDSTIAGLVRMMNAGNGVPELLTEIIDPLLLKHGYVDDRVIAELVEYGRSTLSEEAVETVLCTMLALLGRDLDHEHIKMIDSRYAAAVRHRLFEFCIDALLAYGDEIVCDIAELIYCISYGLFLIALHSKTSRSLRERKEDILAALDALQKKSGTQFDEIRSLIDDAVEAASCATCCNCLKDVDRKKLLFCKRCGVEGYCSLACQSESYALGHDKLCEEVVQDSDVLRGKGLSETELERLTVLNRNLMMNGCRLVRKKAPKILDEVQQDIEGMADFGEYPPVVEVSRSGEGESSGSLKFIFRAQVYYGFAEKVDLQESVLVKFISRRSLDNSVGQFA